MEYNELDQKNKYYANGKIAQFIDAYIRQHKVWTPEQMLESFVEKLEAILKSGEFNRHYEGGKEVWTSEIADSWLISASGKAFALGRMEKKYEKDKPVARANSPIVERVRLGYRWNESKFFDIAYGLKHGFNFVETEELKKYPHRPWVVDHVDQQLQDLYETNLPSVLEALSTSPIEKMFYEHWVNNFYNSGESPALIPEVCGFRAKFYYHEYKGLAYAEYKDLPPVDDPANVKTKNFRFDFFVSNTKKRKAAFIELDGHESHKTKPQRIIDSIKRNTAASLGIPVVVFTGTQLHADLAACFDSIDDLLSQ